MKRIYKGIVGGIILIFIVIFIGFYWLTTSWRNYISIEELSNYASSIKKTPPLSSDFKDIYFKIYPKQSNTTLNNELIHKLLNDIFNNEKYNEEYNCSCDDILYEDWQFTSNLNKKISSKDPLMYIKIGYGLEKYLTNDQCLNYSLRLQYYKITKSSIGYSFSGKKFEELKITEIIDFIVALKAPMYFSPILHPDKYKRRKDEITKLILEH